MYTIESYIIGIITALVGLSYPFFFQIIARIDEKYDSYNMVRLFNKEWAYKWYNGLLISCLVLTLVIPLTKCSYDSNEDFRFNSLQFCVYILLILTLGILGCLVYLIRIYYEPIRLHKRIEKKLKNKINDSRKELKKLKRKYLLHEVVRRQESECISLVEKNIRYRRQVKINKKIDKIYVELNRGTLIYKCMSDFFKYTVNGRDTELYTYSARTFGLCLEQSRINVKEVNINGAKYTRKKYKSSVQYPQAIYTTINNVIQECINKASINPSLINPADILYALFPESSVMEMKDETFSCIWYNLKKFEAYGRIEWIENFWGRWVQYANDLSESDYETDSKNENKIKSELLFRLQEFGDMLCAFLISKDHYDVVLRLRRYSNSIPYINSLVPKGTSFICRHLFEFELNHKADIRYPFDSNYGVNSGNIALFWLRVYYFLSFELFPQVEDDLTGEYFNSNGDKDGICKENYRWELESIITTLKGIYAQSSESADNSYLISIDEWKKLLHEFDIQESGYTSIISRIEAITDELKIEDSSPDLNVFMGKVKDEVIEKMKDFILENTGNIQKELKLYSIQLGTITIPDTSLNSYDSSQPVGLVTSVASIYIRQISTLFSNAYFLLTSPCKKYTIDFSQIEDALEKFELDDSFSLIFLGIPHKTIRCTKVKKCNIHYLFSERSSMIIMKTSDMPYWVVDKSNTLSINESPDAGKKDKTVRISVEFKFFDCPDRFRRYVELKVMQLEYRGVPSMLDKIEPIKKSIV